jgi:hypothetical protein
VSRDRASFDVYEERVVRVIEEAVWQSPGRVDLDPALPWTRPREDTYLRGQEAVGKERKASRGIARFEVCFCRGRKEPS